MLALSSDLRRLHCTFHDFLTFIRAAIRSPRHAGLIPGPKPRPTEQRSVRGYQWAGSCQAAQNCKKNRALASGDDKRARGVFRISTTSGTTGNSDSSVYSPPSKTVGQSKIKRSATVFDRTSLCPESWVRSPRVRNSGFTRMSRGDFLPFAAPSARSGRNDAAGQGNTFASKASRATA